MNSTATAEESELRASFLRQFNLPLSARPNEVRDAYRGLAKRMHPDLVGPEARMEATIKFQQINEAYECLVDPSKFQTNLERRRRWKAANGGLSTPGGLNEGQKWTGSTGLSVAYPQPASRPQWSTNRDRQETGSPFDPRSIKERQILSRIMLEFDLIFDRLVRNETKRVLDKPLRPSIEGFWRKLDKYVEEARVGLLKQSLKDEEASFLSRRSIQDLEDYSKRAAVRFREQYCDRFAEKEGEPGRALTMPIVVGVGFLAIPALLIIGATVNGYLQATLGERRFEALSNCGDLLMLFMCFLIPIALFIIVIPRMPKSPFVADAEDLPD
jgi:curved DNA-binding protein CbpA